MMLMGIINIMIAKPARVLGPKTCHNIVSDIKICRGADHIVFRYVIMSIKRCASTDIRFTISPTVDVVFDADVNFNAYRM